MKKIVFSFIGLAFLLVAFSAYAAVGDDCTVDADCVAINPCKVGSCSSETSTCVEDDKDCGDNVCDELDGSCVECLVDEDCDEGFCVEELKVCAECEVDLDCTDNETPFCSDTLECMQCLEDLDCAEGETCELGECIEPAACNLFIRPQQLNLKKGVRPIKQMFTIKGVAGEEGFDPLGEIDFGPCEIVESFVAGDSDVLKVRIEVPDNATFEGDSLDVQVGECTGQVFLKKPNQKQIQKQLLKEQKKQERMEMREQKRLEKEEKKAAKKAAKEAKKAGK
jgi:Cys-rich repeat protein